ncbi:hypothetical protein JZU48_05290 [bacterium]|nr:hypothetical protein [bacterium]
MLLRTRIIVFVLLVVCGVAGLVFSVGFLREREMTNRIGELQLQQFEQAWAFAVAGAAEGVAVRLKHVIGGDGRIAEAVGRGDRQALAQLAAELFTDDAFLRVNVYGGGGELLWAGGDALDPVPLVGSGRLADMRRDGRTVGGARALPDGRLGIVGATPVDDVVVDRTGHGAPRRVGALAAAVPLNEALEAFQRAVGGRVFARGSVGALVFGRDDSLWRSVRAATPTVRRSLTVVAHDGRSHEAALLHAVDLTGGRLATVLVVRDVTEQLERRALWDKASAGGVIFSFVAAMLLLYLYLRRNFEVLDDAVAALHDLSRGARGGYVELPGGSDEIGRIAQAVEGFGRAVGEVGG